MKKLFLTSQASNVISTIAQGLDLTKNNKLVFISTATETKEHKPNGWLDQDKQSLVDAGFEVTDYTVTVKTKSEIETDLANYDYIYVSGGDTIHLLEQSYKSGFVKVIKKLIESDGKTYIGCSAGSIACSELIPSYYDIDAQIVSSGRVAGYGLVNFTIMPHWGRGDFKEKYFGERLEAIFNENQMPFIFLNDNQYVEVSENDLKVIDITNR